MTTELRISRKAQEDLDTIEDRIAPDNPQAAFEFIEAVTETFERISEWPESGRAIHRKTYRMTCVAGFRQYVVVWRMSSGWVEISRVFRAELDIHQVFPKKNGIAEE